MPLEVAELARLAAAILHDREALSANLRHDDSRAVDQIFRVGASAGGARAKAVVAWNPATGEVRSGQVPALAGFEPWILKFDGVHDTALGDPRGYGRVEYAYNRDDHTRNIAFLMDRAGRWRQAPAFDVVWAHNPAGRWTDRHQLSIGGKREDITRADLLELAARMGLDDAPGIIDEVAAAVARWREFADEASVPGDLARHIGGVIAG